MKHLKKFESNGRFVQSNLEQIKSYFQDIEDEFDIKIKFEVGSSNNVKMILPISNFIKSNLNFVRDSIDGRIYSTNFGNKLLDTFSQLSKFYELLCVSINQLLNDSDFEVMSKYPIMQDSNIGDIIIIIKFKE